MGSNNSISPRHNIGMVVIVYGSATLVYVQLMFLAAFLQTVATPPGLIFLVLSLGYIAYIVFKVNNFIHSSYGSQFCDSAYILKLNGQLLWLFSSQILDGLRENKIQRGDLS